MLASLHLTRVNQLIELAKRILSLCKCLYIESREQNDMKLENMNQLCQFVDEADLVLVGLGQEWMVTYEEVLEQFKTVAPILASIYEYTNDKLIYMNVRQLLEGYYYSKYCPNRLEKAYHSLLKLVNNKNYFVISLTTDPYLSRFDFKSDRIVNPCGTYEKMQCNQNCHDELFDACELYGQLYSHLDKLAICDDPFGQGKLSDTISELQNFMNRINCKKCKEKIVFNTLDAVKYNECGYLEQWQIYMKWLQGTLNKNICIIEAGAGMELPSIIRWPFEKTAFYNQKAKMIRIHHKFYQVNEDISERAYGMNQNAVDFFVQG